VGGYVRDQWMGRPLKMDIDFVVVGSGIDLPRRFNNNSSHAQS